MKKFNFIFICILSLVFSSCLKSNLEEGEYSTECDITNIKFEHRWAEAMDTPGMYELNFKEMSVSKNIDNENCVVEVEINVPASDANYPEEERQATSLSKIACSLELSRAASVKPLGNAPVLGTLGDYTVEHTYRVVSASGEYKDWIIRVISFNK
ncbi:hypothetical protein H6A61_13905 [Bacteroides caecigallinarum]|uniref:DUF5018-related domain-containing protein n=1 Tax=Bacteroides caecigallinarum TaxID=1411144 RepID=UPI0019568E36|nr:hypothetical protein [Bacteroides caecigallinarum]MBM6961931.1 hypothetical protein [Bacteroides caecigallinarum]